MPVFNQTGGGSKTISAVVYSSISTGDETKNYTFSGEFAGVVFGNSLPDTPEKAKFCTDGDTFTISNSSDYREYYHFTPYKTNNGCKIVVDSDTEYPYSEDIYFVILAYK